MNLSFRARMTLWYVGALTVLLALTAVTLLKVVNLITQRRMDAALGVIAESEVERVEAGLPIRRMASTSDNAAPKHYVTVLDTGRRVLNHSGNLSSALPVDDAAFAKALTGRTVYKSAAIPGVGILRIAYIRADLPLPASKVVLVGLQESYADKDIRTFQILMGASFLGIVILTGITAMALADRALRPIRGIANEAEAINPEDLSARLRDTGSNDEFSRLVSVFNTLLSRIDSVFEAQRRFTSRAAHELRTPLTILKGETQVILRSRRTVEEYQATLYSSLEEIDKMVAIIDDLLLMARYESGEAEIPRDIVPLADVVGNVVHELSPLAEARKVEVKTDASPECVVVGDRRALARLVSKLVENALFYTHPGGKVSVGLQIAAQKVVLSVEDTGVGIKSEDLPNIFQRFYRSPSARDLRPEGVGIGLATVALIAQLHDAQIDVQSEEGRGTRVQVRFRAA
jgi:two-component system, OmpR family, sensor kinase